MPRPELPVSEPMEASADELAKGWQTYSAENQECYHQARCPPPPTGARYVSSTPCTTIHGHLASKGAVCHYEQSVCPPCGSGLRRSLAIATRSN
jgi:hypothetical protein